LSTASRVVAEIEVEVVLNIGGLVMVVVPYSSDTRNKGQAISEKSTASRSYVTEDADDAAVVPAAEIVTAEQHVHRIRTNSSTFLAAVDDDMSSATFFKPLMSLMPSAPVAVAAANITILIPNPAGLQRRVLACGVWRRIIAVMYLFRLYSSLATCCSAY
jgi:hypothetical protein